MKILKTGKGQCIIPARTPISMKTSAPHELMGPKARLWVRSPTSASSCSSEQDSLSWPSQSTALLQPPGRDTAPRVEDTQNNSSVKHLGTNRQHKEVFSCAHLNSTALNKRISVVWAPQTMYPIASSMLESNWLTLSLVEFNMVVNRAASCGENKSYEFWCNFFCLVFIKPILI